MAKILIGRVLDGDTDSVQALAALVPEKHDTVQLGYTGTNLTSVVFRVGGASGTIVATLALAYTGDRLDSVVRT